MGSKMSFSRGSSEKNTNSVLTSVATHPHSSVHAPSDCNKIPEDNRCCKEELDSRWREEMKATELTQAAAQSHSFGHMESDGLNSETVGGTDCQHGEPHIAMEAKSQMTSASVCSSTTDSHGEPVEVDKKRGSPRKRKPMQTVDEKHPGSVGVDAVQHKEISTTIPLPSCLENHNNNDNMSNVIVSPVVNDLPPNDRSDPHTLSDCKVEDGVPVLPKKRRGRPRKGEITLRSLAPSANISISGPAQRLRSREEKPLTRDGKTDLESKGDPKKTEITLTESSNRLNFQGNKRRRAKLVSQSVINQQVPAKVSRLDVSQEDSSVLRNDPDSGERAETDKQVELITDKRVTDRDGMGDHLAPQSEDGLDEQTGQKEGASLQREIKSPPVAEPENTPAEGLNSLNLESPTQSDDPKITQTTDKDASEEARSKNSLESPRDAILQNIETSCTEAVTSSEQPPVGVLPAIKTENIEIELAHVNHVSESNTSLQYNDNITVRSGGSNGGQNFYRRKKGGKRRRRRRRSNALLPSADLAEPPEGNNDTQQKNNCGDVDNVGSSNDNVDAIYTKKGGKTLLKCGQCGQTCKYLSQFIIHKRVHTGERPFKCSECGRGFSKNSNLNLHLKTHKKNNLYRKCPVCKINFCCAEYASHMKMHALVPGQDSDGNKSEKRHEGNDVEYSPADSIPKSPEKRERQVCQYCGKKFRFPSALIRHVRVHTGEKPYICDICGKAFGQAYFLRVHELTHWSVKRYNCTRCEKSFTHYSNAKNHSCRPLESGKDLQLKRRIKPSLTYTCHICKDVFDCLPDFNGHMRDHTGTKLYRCVYCDKLFGLLSEYNSHRTQCPRGRAASGSEVKEEETLSLIPYTVPALRYSSGQNSAAPLTAANSERRQKALQTSRKKRSISLKKPFQSTDIPAHPLSHFVSKLNQLDTRSDPREYLCPSCGRLFRHMGRLRAHMLTHAPGQSYTCTCCGKTLENWRKLWHHQRIHRQRRGRFTCPQCGQGFRFVEPYKKHMREHPEFQWIQVRPKRVLLPYQCEQCRCSFKTLDTLFSHQLCHSSTQDVHKGTDFDLSIDDHSTQSNTKMFSPPINNNIVALHPEHKVSPLSPVSKYPDSAPQASPLTTKISFVQNEGSDSSKTLHCPGNTHSIQDGEDILNRLDEKLPSKPSTPPGTVKRGITQTASISKEGSSDGVTCAICGNAYPAISDLYRHYLQHARGEVF